MATTASTAACENQTSIGSRAGPAASGAAVRSSGGSGCSRARIGYPKIEVEDAIIGFSPSEKEASRFRTAETQSVRGKAAELGVLTQKLLATNAQRNLNKQIGNIKSPLDRNAQLPVVAPVDSDGLPFALDATRGNHQVGRTASPWTFGASAPNNINLRERTCPHRTFGGGRLSPSLPRCLASRRWWPPHCLQ
jgi:ABC-type sugar transport system substrate-binding protein